MKTDLDKLREQLDHIDQQILELISERMEVVKKVGEYKLKNNLPILDEKRKKTMIENRIEKGEKLNLPTNFVRSLYEHIHDLALSREEELKK